MAGRLLALLLAALLIPECLSCTSVRFPAVKDKYPDIIGRTMELGLGKPFVAWNLTAHPRGSTLGHEPTLLGKLLCNTSITWKVKYAFIGLESGGINQGLVPEGMNEMGFTISGLTLRVSSFPLYSNMTLLPLCYPMLTTYLLSTVATVKQAKEAIQRLEVTDTLSWVGDLDFMKIHWIMSDASGDHMILEVIDKKLVWYKDQIGVLTNDPAYPWHVENLNNYVGVDPVLPDLTNVEVHTDQGPVPQINSYGTNLLGIPGDLSPPSRFIRMFFLRQFVLAEQPPQSLNETLATVTALLNNIFIVKGTVAKLVEGNNPEMTHWAVLKVPSMKRIYYRTYDNMQWKLIDLNAMNKTHEWTIPVQTDGIGAVNITGQI
eukprot:Sspe_Gene.14390::Locus_4978_Transcript_3_3_Confidence_0.600_Length_1196::g.14390::m.14390/K01442/E3.5.1.24; choloylglycine hydrolase